MSLKSLVNHVITRDSPLYALQEFLDEEAVHEQARQTDLMRFVGYVLDLGYDSAKIITSDPYKLAVGGIPRGSFLIMTPNNLGEVTPHFTLLRVTGVSTTPLSNQVQQTYFELHKKSMPELDVWTQSELQWGALDCEVLGMFYTDPSDSTKLSFSGDVNNVVSAHRYKVYSPTIELLSLIVNGTVTNDLRYNIGVLRTMECQLGAETRSDVPVYISMKDFKGTRTAMFGKTRLGKSNVVKLIAQGMIEATKEEKSVGQLIFDINGEYANDNPQDGNSSIRSAYEERSKVYALTPRPGTPSEPLRINFYEQPDSGLQILASMLRQDAKDSNYITAFTSSELPSLDSIKSAPDKDRTRLIRKVQIYWAILNHAGFKSNESKLRALGLTSWHAKHFNPGFGAETRKLFHGSQPKTEPSTLEELTDEMVKAASYIKDNSIPSSSGSGGPLFDKDEEAMLRFLVPKTGDGPRILRNYMKYHSPNAGDFINDILSLLDGGMTVILDLGNASDEIRKYFSEMLSRAVFQHQETKFVGNRLGNHFIQLYFEEAHNLFPPNNNDLTGVYARFAKEGAKFHIGMVYSTQSPSTINKELLAQTENFFVGHLSSTDETKALSRLQIAFTGIEDDILRAKTPGYMRMLSLSHRFVIPLQARKYEAITPSIQGGQ